RSGTEVDGDVNEIPELNEVRRRGIDQLQGVLAGPSLHREIDGSAGTTVGGVVAGDFDLAGIMALWKTGRVVADEHGDGRVGRDGGARRRQSQPAMGLPAGVVLAVRAIRRVIERRISRVQHGHDVLTGLTRRNDHAGGRWNDLDVRRRPKELLPRGDGRRWRRPT